MSCGVCLSNNGKVTEVNISDNWSVDHYINELGYTLFSECGFNYSKDSKIILFAKKNGKVGTENKHELPPPLDSHLFYDDIYVFKTSCDELSTLSLTKYEFRRLYINAFKGFRSIDNESERSEDESSIGSLCDFIVDDDEEIEYYDTDSDEDSDKDSDEENS